MVTDFGVPPTAPENRALVEERLRELKESGGVKETLTVEWRGQPLHVEVIDMPVAALYYNPGSHRIRAQRSHDLVRDRALDKDVWDAESQEYLDYLLKALPSDPAKSDPAYDDLLFSLRDFAQTDPGLITRDGILVNGNTRRAALMQLGIASIRVGVLPASCTWTDIQTVELSLQLRRDHRRDYSYINSLLALEEQVAVGRSLQDIAREFRTTAAACERDLWVLSQLRDLITRSRSGDRGLRLLDFENSKEKLLELYRRYSKEHARSKEDADVLKEWRLAAIALDFAKTDVRHIEPDFSSRYLDRVLPASLKAASPAGPTSVVIPGLNRSVQATGSKLAAARALTDTVVKAKAVQAGGELVTVAQLTEASSTLSDASRAFEEAIDFAGRDSRVRKKRQAAPDRIAEACKDLEQCVTDVVLARGSNSLDEEGFDEAVLQLRAILARLAIESARSIKSPGDGVTWLIGAVAEED